MVLMESSGSFLLVMKIHILLSLEKLMESAFMDSGFQEFYFTSKCNNFTYANEILDLTKMYVIKQPIHLNI